KDCAAGGLALSRQRPSLYKLVTAPAWRGSLYCAEVRVLSPRGEGGLVPSLTESRHDPTRAEPPECIGGSPGPPGPPDRPARPAPPKPEAAKPDIDKAAAAAAKPVTPKPLSPAVKKGLEYLVAQQHPNGGWGQGGGWRVGNQGGRVEGAEVQDPPDVGNTCIA